MAVNIDGLVRTKNDIVMESVKGLFQVWQTLSGVSYHGDIIKDRFQIDIFTNSFIVKELFPVDIVEVLCQVDISQALSDRPCLFDKYSRLSSEIQ